MHPQDVVVALTIRLVSPGQPSWNYPLLSAFIGLSVSQCHVACQGLMESRLVRQDPGEPWMASARNLTEFLVHGIRYAMPAATGGPTRGVPTGRTAVFVAEELGVAETTTVWPSVEGVTQGNAVQPLHACQMRCVGKPEAERLYQALVLVDMLRLGPDPDSTWAKDRLAKLLKQQSA